MLSIAFIGFRHGHIDDLHARALAHPDLTIVACCEEDAATRAHLATHETINVTHDNYAKMLAEVSVDIVAVGEYYAVRGARIIDALRAGKHVIIDKPICTRLPELDEIEPLAQTQKRCVGAMLDMRDNGVSRALRRLIRAGEIGAIHAIHFGGQHPLNYGSRPAWYFEEGKHGGTINDIAVHAIDLIPWVCGVEFATINAARSWNGALSQVPHFRDCAQMMLTLENGCGVIGDVSYLAPDSHGYSLPLYWQQTYWGANGVIEANPVAGELTLYKNGESSGRTMPPDAGEPGGYLAAFLAEIAGATPTDGALTTAQVIAASRFTLEVQAAATATT